MSNETPESYPEISEEQQRTVAVQSMFRTWSENIERLRQAVDSPQADIDAYRQRIAERSPQGHHPLSGLPLTSA